MKSILHDYLNIIKILKLAKLSDEEYRTVYDPSGKFTSGFLNPYEKAMPHGAVERLESMPISEEIAQQVEEITGDTLTKKMRSLYDLFLFAKPDIPVNELIKERNETTKKESNKDIKDFISKINYDQSLLKFDGNLSKLNDMLDVDIEETDSVLKRSLLKRIKRLLERSDETSIIYDNIIQYLEPYYYLNIDENTLLSIIDLFVAFKQDSDNEGLAEKLENELLKLLEQKHSMGSVKSSRVKLIDKILDIRHSDIFDFLKDELKKKPDDELQELTSGDVIPDIVEPEPEQLVDRNEATKVERPFANEPTRADIVACFVDVFTIIKKF
jgi:hypothetical protein